MRDSCILFNFLFINSICEGILSSPLFKMSRRCGYRVTTLVKECWNWFCGSKLKIIRNCLSNYSNTPSILNILSLFFEWMQCKEESFSLAIKVSFMMPRSCLHLYTSIDWIYSRPYRVIFLRSLMVIGVNQSSSDCWPIVISNVLHSLYVLRLNSSPLMY